MWQLPVTMFSPTLRAPSDAALSRTGLRIGLGFLGRMASNAFEEFWPEVRHGVFKRRDEPPSY